MPPAPFNPGIAALRAMLTILVVFHHTAITYGALGAWFYQEIPPDASLSASLLAFFCSVNQAYFMGLFFLLAGYYTWPALAQKGPRRFMTDRLLRLGLPLLFFGWVLGPATIALAQTARGRPFFATWLQLTRAGVFENGPLWFAQALLIFSVGAVIVWRFRPSLRESAREATPVRAFPSNITLAFAAVLAALAALALRTRWPVGVNVWGLQLGYFASYVLLFATGCMAAGPRWLEQLPAAQVRLWRRISLIALPVLPAAFFLSQALPQLRGEVFDAIYAFWEPFVAWGAIMLLLTRFQQRFDSLPGAWEPLARRAYAIYIVHPPVVVAVALAWRDWPAPALVKFALTGSLSCLLCYLIAGVLLQSRALRSVL